MTARATILDHLSALADQTRSRILLLVDRRELTVSEICTVLQLPQSTVSRHLKILADEGWLVARGEGTSRYYSMVLGRLDPSLRRLWRIVRDEVASATGAAQDARRLSDVLAHRRSKSQIFFNGAAGAWDTLRTELIGQRADMLALLDLLDDHWVLGDLGCGTGHITEVVAPCVSRVIAVDESGPMLAAARDRLKPFRNAELRDGSVEDLPIEDAELDVAVMFLVAHFVADPARALNEVRRVLKPGGRVLIVDLMPHDRAEYVVQLGHVWQGFAADRVKQWLVDAEFDKCKYRPLPPDPGAKGPTLFAATGRKRASIN
jgi:SAM-dependent methyltransferase